MKKILPFFSFALAVSSLLAGCSPRVASVLPAADMSAALPAGTPYAVIHLYRPSKLVGFAIGYDVRLNDSVVYRASNGSQRTVPRRAAGPFILSAKTEAHTETVLDVQPGREYYVRCSLGAGALVGRPHLAQVSVAEGSKAVAGLPAAAPASPVK